MAAPRLLWPVELLAPVAAADGAGGQAIAWQSLGVLRAELRAGAGREAEGVVPMGRVAWRITVPAAPAGHPARPRPGQRLRLGARVFSVLAVAEADPRGRYLTCHATEEEPA